MQAREASMRDLSSKVATAFRRSGVDSAHWPDSINALLERLEVLHRTGRYSKLLRDLFRCNDESNLRSLLLEIAFAYHFESEEQPLRYEVKRASLWASTVDFLWCLRADFSVYFEVRLIQQRNWILHKVQQQLAKTGWFGIFLNEAGEQQEITRVQNIVLSKCQNSEGKPVKFFRVNPGQYNIIVADVTQPMLGMVDRYDCVLAAYGDARVDEVYRRGVFGVFQEPHPDDPEDLGRLAMRFSHLRSTIHGILFLKKRRGGDAIAFDLGHCFVPNTSLLGHNDVALLREGLAAVLDPWPE